MAQHITQKSIYGIYVGLIIIFGLLYNIRHLLMFTTEKMGAQDLIKFFDIQLRRCPTEAAQVKLLRRKKNKFLRNK